MFKGKRLVHINSCFNDIYYDNKMLKLVVNDVNALELPKSIHGVKLDANIKSNGITNYKMCYGYQLSTKEINTEWI